MELKLNIYVKVTFTNRSKRGTLLPNLRGDGGGISLISIVSSKNTVIPFRRWIWVNISEIKNATRFLNFYINKSCSLLHHTLY